MGWDNQIWPERLETNLIEVFVVLGRESMVTVFSGLSTQLWHLTLYRYSCIRPVHPPWYFFHSRESEGSGLLCCCIVGEYFMTCGAMRVIWDVCSVMLFYPSFKACLWESIKSYLFCREQAHVIFPSFLCPLSLSGLLNQLLRILSFLWLLSMVLLLCLLSTVCTTFRVSVAHTMFRIRRDISKESYSTGWAVTSGMECRRK